MPSTPVSALLVGTYLGGGGAERVVSTLLRHFDRARVRPSLCLLRSDSVGEPPPPDVSVTTLGYRASWHLPVVVRRLRRLIEATTPEVVLGNVNATNLAVGLALAGSCHRPAWVARIGSNPTLHDRGLRRILARRAYPLADRFVANARGLVEDIERCYPFSQGRIEVLANPTDFAAIDRQAAEPAAIREESGEPLIITTGRLFRVKRLDLLIDAFSLVHAQTPVRLWICGEGPCRGALDRQIRRLGLEDSVRLLGFVANLFPLLRQATLFVLSSDYEGLPNSLIEAQGLGLPAVSTRCRYGPDEILEDGVTGLLTPVGDKRALAEAMLELLADPERLESMGAAARRISRDRFAVAPLTRQWERLLAELSE